MAKARHTDKVINGKVYSLTYGSERDSVAGRKRMKNKLQKIRGRGHIIKSYRILPKNNNLYLYVILK